MCGSLCSGKKSPFQSARNCDDPRPRRVCRVIETISSMMPLHYFEALRAFGAVTDADRLVPDKLCCQLRVIKHAAAVGNGMRFGRDLHALNVEIIWPILAGQGSRGAGERDCCRTSLVKEIAAARPRHGGGRQCVLRRRAMADYTARLRAPG